MILQQVMEQQEQLSNFQIPFELGSGNSINRVSAVPNLSREAEQILVGSLLGDGSLLKKNKNHNSSFVEHHCIAQKEYILWKEKILAKHLIIKYREYYSHNHKYTEIRSLVNSKLNHFYNLFYINDKKEVTKKILSKLKPLGIAVLYCDDGSYNYANNSCELGVFFGDGNILIKRWFKEKYDINSTITKSGLLRFNVIETKKFLKLIRRYVPKCMNYKVGEDMMKSKIAKDKMKKYYLDNRERIRQLQKKSFKKYYYNNKEKKSRYAKKYYLKNKNAILRKIKIRIGNSIKRNNNLPESFREDIEIIKN